MDEKKESGLFSITFSFVTGALIGAGLALLFAPVTGKEAREIVGDRMDDLKEELKKLEEKVNQGLAKIKKDSEEEIN
jgi:gas vesicle protein